ncbi:hypothetical protein GCM10020218_093100 [Dactylosporangium vinaceum]
MPRASAVVRTVTPVACAVRLGVADFLCYGTGLRAVPDRSPSVPGSEVALAIIRGRDPVHSPGYPQISGPSPPPARSRSGARFLPNAQAHPEESTLFETKVTIIATCSRA